MRPSRSSSRTTDVLYITAGDTRRRTGGNIYAQRMLAGLRRDGIRVRTVVLRSRHTDALPGAHPRVALVDTIAADLAAPAIRTLRARGTRVFALALMSRGARALARHSDRVISPSAALRDELIASRIHRSAIVVIPPGVDRVATPSAGHDARVLCVANWTREKGIVTLLAAIAAVKDASLDLVGDRPDRAYAARVRAMLRAPALADRVRVHGSLGGASLERLYQRASVFALPSSRESYGMALAAAIARGIPSVACDIPATREVAGDAALLIPACRTGPLADALRTLITDGALRGELHARALRRARSYATWEESERTFARIVRRELAAAAGDAWHRKCH